MTVSLIVARSKNNGIGKNNDLLWHLPADMKFFKETTAGSPVIMGRKNYDSIPPRFRPLPGRENVVITRNKEFSEEGIHVVHSIEESLEIASKMGKDEVFIIGGGQIYREALEKNLVDKMYITEVDAEFEADTFFPEFQPSEWAVSRFKEFPQDEKNAYTAQVFVYLKKD